MASETPITISKLKTKYDIILIDIFKYAIKAEIHINVTLIAIRGSNTPLNCLNKKNNTNGRILNIASDLSEKVWPLLGAGRLNPVIDSVFELSDAGSAHLLMESSKHIGKILLKVEQ